MFDFLTQNIGYLASMGLATGVLFRYLYIKNSKLYLRRRKNSLQYFYNRTYDLRYYRYSVRPSSINTPYNDWRDYFYVEDIPRNRRLISVLKSGKPLSGKMIDLAYRAKSEYKTDLLHYLALDVTNNLSVNQKEVENKSGFSSTDVESILSTEEKTEANRRAAEPKAKDLATRQIDDINNTKQWSFLHIAGDKSEPAASVATDLTSGRIRTRANSDAKSEVARISATDLISEQKREPVSDNKSDESRKHIIADDKPVESNRVASVDRSAAKPVSTSPAEKMAHSIVKPVSIIANVDDDDAVLLKKYANNKVKQHDKDEDETERAFHRATKLLAEVNKRAAEDKSEASHTIGSGINSAIKAASADTENKSEQKQAPVLSGAKSAKMVHVSSENNSANKVTSAVSEIKPDKAEHAGSENKSDKKMPVGSENKSAKKHKHAAKIRSDKKMSVAENKSAPKPLTTLVKNLVINDDVDDQQDTVLDEKVEVKAKMLSKKLVLAKKHSAEDKSAKEMSVSDTKSAASKPIAESKSAKEISPALSEKRSVKKVVSAKAENKSVKKQTSDSELNSAKKAVQTGADNLSVQEKIASALKNKNLTLRQRNMLARKANLLYNKKQKQ